MNDRVLHEVAQTPSRLNNITPADFEDLMAKVFAGLGYVVEQTKRTRDGGIDILAVKNIDDVSLRFLIECKRYQRKNLRSCGFPPDPPAFRGLNQLYSPAT